MRKTDKNPLDITRPFVYAELIGTVELCGVDYAVIQREHDGQCFYSRHGESPRPAVLSELRAAGFTV